MRLELFCMTFLITYVIDTRYLSKNDSMYLLNFEKIIEYRNSEFTG
jgi:hypothetical protein